jgi:GT2 family glycosyltransferase
VAAGELEPDEVIVVVDRNPSLFESLAGEEWPVPVRVMESPGSGLAAARNAGWRAASSPLVAFIDDDAVASREWLRDLVGALEAHAADIVGGFIAPRWSDGEPAWYTPRLGWVVGCSYDGMPQEAARVRNVIGCNMLMRRDLLLRLDGFAITLGRTDRGLAGCEETELCIRANRAGASVVLIPGAPVEQVLPHDRRQLRYAIRRGWGEGRSKRALVALHGHVLATEAAYSRAVVRQVAGLVVSGVSGRRLADLHRTVGLVAVLGATFLSYLVHWRPRPAPRMAPVGDPVARP